MNNLQLSFRVTHVGFELAIDQELPMKGIIGVFGHSGSGKSTLLRTIAGLDKNAIGEITLNDRPLLNSSNNFCLKPEKRRIGLVFQDSRLFSHLNVKENLLFSHTPCKNSHLNFDEIIKLTELCPLADKAVETLSGGEKQRVALARTLLCELELLLLDEPLSALDKDNKSLLMLLIKKIQKQLNIPVLYVSHSLTELQQVSDHLLVMNKGKVTHFGDIHQVIHQLNHADSHGQQTSLSLPIKSHLPEFGLSCLALSGDNGHEQEIYLPLHLSKPEQEYSKGSIGQLVRCFISANDVSITLSDPIDSSIVNQLAGTIVKIEPGKSNSQNILVTIQCNQQEFFALITAWSYKQLKLSINTPVHVQFKAGAVRTLYQTM